MKPSNQIQYTSGGGALARYPGWPIQPMPYLEWLRKQPTQFDRSQGEVVVLPDGSTVPDPDSGTGSVMSPVADLHKVAADGRLTGEVFRSMLDNSETSINALLYLYTTLWRNL